MKKIKITKEILLKQLTLIKKTEENIKKTVDNIKEANMILILLDTLGKINKIKNEINKKVEKL